MSLASYDLGRGPYNPRGRARQAARSSFPCDAAPPSCTDDLVAHAFSGERWALDKIKIERLREELRFIERYGDRDSPGYWDRVERARGKLVEAETTEFERRAADR